MSQEQQGKVPKPAPASTKQNFKAALGPKVSKTISSSPDVKSALQLHSSPQITSSAVNLAIQTLPSTMPATPPPAASKKVLNPALLVGADSADYNQRKAWVQQLQPQFQKLLPLPALLAECDSYGEFQAFMTSVKPIVDFPSGIKDDRVEQLTAKVNAFRGGTGATTAPGGPQPTGAWGSAPPPSSPGGPAKAWVQPSPAKPKSTVPAKPTSFLVTASARKHRDDLRKVPENNDLPGPQGLMQFVQDMWVDANPNEEKQRWTISLGDRWTHEGYGQYKKVPWSILVGFPEKGVAKIFHYGPTSLEPQ